MQKLRIVTARGDRKWSLNEGENPNCSVVRAALSKGYKRVEGNWQRVTHPKSLTFRFVFLIAEHGGRGGRRRRKLLQETGQYLAVVNNLLQAMDDDGAASAKRQWLQTKL
jgi:hypothetical protein